MWIINFIFVAVLCFLYFTRKEDEQKDKENNAKALRVSLKIFDKDGEVFDWWSNATIDNDHLNFNFFDNSLISDEDITLTNIFWLPFRLIKSTFNWYFIVLLIGIINMVHCTLDPNSLQLVRELCTCGIWTYIIAFILLYTDKHWSPLINEVKEYMGYNKIKNTDNNKKIK